MRIVNSKRKDNSTFGQKQVLPPHWIHSSGNELFCVAAEEEKKLNRGHLMRFGTQPLLLNAQYRYAAFRQHVPMLIHAELHAEKYSRNEINNSKTRIMAKQMNHHQ